MSDDNKKDEYTLLKDLLKNLTDNDELFTLPDLSDTFPSDWDDYEDRVDDSSLFNPNKS